MTLTKANIAEALADQNGYSKEQSFDTVEIFLEIIKSVLESGKDIVRSEILMDGCFYRIGLNLKLKT
jgi:nucleoid DNA-binding protein